MLHNFLTRIKLRDSKEVTLTFSNEEFVNRMKKIMDSPWSLSNNILSSDKVKFSGTVSNGQLSFRKKKHFLETGAIHMIHSSGRFIEEHERTTLFITFTSPAAYSIALLTIAFTLLLVLSRQIELAFLIFPIYLLLTLLIYLNGRLGIRNAKKFFLNAMKEL
jgi:hypothetical protein